jgi:hypothetical protein
MQQASGLRNVMAKVGLTRAAELTGKSPSTIHRAMRKGRLSFETDEHGSRLVDVSELDRAFGLITQEKHERNGSVPLQSDGMQLVKLRAQLEVEHARTAFLEERVRDLILQRDEVREDRDRWRAQAERLLTDQRDPRPTETTPRRVSWWRRTFSSLLL